MDNIEKIDMLKGRLGVSYEQAYQALEECNGDVVQALIKLEKENKGKKDSNYKTDFVHVKGQELINKIKEIIQEGNVNKISIKNDDKTVLEIPVNAGLAGLVLFPYITLLAGAAAMYKDYTLEIDKKKNEDSEANT